MDCTVILFEEMNRFYVFIDIFRVDITHYKRINTLSWVNKFIHETTRKKQVFSFHIHASKKK